MTDLDETQAQPDLAAEMVLAREILIDHFGDDMDQWPYWVVRLEQKLALVEVYAP